MSPRVDGANLLGFRCLELVEQLRHALRGVGERGNPLTEDPEALANDVDAPAGQGDGMCLPSLLDERRQMLRREIPDVDIPERGNQVILDVAPL